MGCLRALFVRIAMTVISLALVVAVVVYHREILDYIDAWRGRSNQTYVTPATGDARKPADALRRLRETDGPAYEDLSAADLAAVIDSSLSRAGRKVFDSVQVALLENEVRVRGTLDVSRVPRNLLGPFAGVLRDREPATIGGPLSVDSTGRLVLTVTHLEVRDFPFPKGTIPRILQELRIPDSQGARVPLPLGTRLGDVRVTPSSVRFYRAGGR